MAERHQLTREERSKGGRNQSREAKVRAGQNGYARTMELHPYFGRKWLKKLIKGSYSREDFNRGN